ncbi:MAG: hypothetical protein LH475_09590 [Cryobacterium sp.]|uniref:hypothetical protein n=1 Tax=unclassified Cryobacterium TaxID=2649013 RepID=UPI0018CAFE76|nr:MULTISPECIES: hypothetical protein [unclassified Cryobacterium]MCY7404862.1 hypothetical protein [Cryobacterium sp.]MEC5154849.1 hypothetical protein [Cryobacterium sp. CAN_C3]
MNSTPSVIMFDGNETLSPMSALHARFMETAAPAYLARVWFAALLRDGFALAAAGGSAKFSPIGSKILRGALRDVALTRSLQGPGPVTALRSLSPRRFCPAQPLGTGS